MVKNSLKKISITTITALLCFSAFTTETKPLDKTPESNTNLDKIAAKLDSKGKDIVKLLKAHESAEQQAQKIFNDLKNKKTAKINGLIHINNRRNKIAVTLKSKHGNLHLKHRLDAIKKEHQMTYNDFTAVIKKCNYIKRFKNTEDKVIGFDAKIIGEDLQGSIYVRKGDYFHTTKLSKKITLNLESKDPLSELSNKLSINLFFELQDYISKSVKKKTQA